MSGTFTDDDIEKTVENANGEVIGTVTAVEGDTARVKPRAGIMDSIKATLGWNRGRDKTVVIHEDAIGERSSETIRLEAESIESVEPLEPGREREAEPTESTDVDPAGDDTEPGREPEIDDRERDFDSEKRERAGGIEESAAEPPDAGSNSHPAAKRDPGSELAEEMSEVAKRDATGVTDEPLDSQREREPAAERDDAFEETDPTDTSGEREADGTDEEASPEPTDDAMPDGTVNGEGRTAVDDRRDGPEGAAETDTQTEETDTQTEPGAVSEARSTESSDSIDGIGERDLGGDSAAGSQEPSRERSGEQDPSRGSSEETAADTNPADELDLGVDIESAIDTPGAEEDRTATEDDDDALGVDIESAADPSDTGGDSSETEPTNLADELDRGSDIDAAVKTDAGSNSETDSRSETESDAETGEETTAEADRSDVEFDPGIDIESAVESERRSEPVIDPDTVAGGGTDAETGAEATAREIVPEGAAATDRTERTTSETAADRPGGGSDGSDRSRGRRRSSSPLAAMISVQRAALIQGQRTLQQSLAAQQRAARGAVEVPLLVQRQSIDAARAATRRYFDAISAVTGTGTGPSLSREQRTSLDEAVTELEDAHSRLADDDLADDLSSHLERIRALQTQLDDLDGAETAQVATLLEQQRRLLEECQRRLDW